MRLLLACAATAAALGSVAVPAQAATVVYGYAWADGKGHLRIVPKSARPVRREGFRGYDLKAIPGAEELRLDYTGAAYRRVTVACDLKETEGRVALDARGLGRTVCEPRHLADQLARGATPLRIAYQGGEAVAVEEFLVGTRPNARTAEGTIKRIDDTTVLFATGGKTIKLGYSYVTTFHRVTRGCRDVWLSGRPVNADRNGLGRKACTHADLTKVLKPVKYPVLAKLRYSAEVGGIDEVWEVYGDA
ncbi:MAG TPA: hypothetical protein VFV66_26840 [Nonomuraea sp.]|nr:hypothetical protein [Nonomuraea sp.]